MRRRAFGVLLLAFALGGGGLVFYGLQLVRVGEAVDDTAASHSPLLPHRHREDRIQLGGELFGDVGRVFGAFFVCTGAAMIGISAVSLALALRPARPKRGASGRGLR